MHAEQEKKAPEGDLEKGPTTNEDTQAVAAEEVTEQERDPRLSTEKEKFEADTDDVTVRPPTSSGESKTGSNKEY